MEKEDLTEEVFCLNFELNTLAAQLLRQSSERWVPGFLYDKTEYSHTERYKLACHYTPGKKVIDIACGVGKGCNMMATTGLAESIYGADIQADAIRYAKWRYGAGNIHFGVNNAEALGIDSAFDIAVSFETIEHLPDYRKFLISVRSALNSGGLFLVSTPISSLPVDTAPVNPYHVQEWGFYRFQEILSEFFDIEKVYVQLYPPVPVYQPAPKTVFLQRMINKLKNKLSNPPAAVSPAHQVLLPAGNFSAIEEYKGQYPVEELGVARQGYQIVLAKLK